MDHVWLLAALWIGLALLATLCAAWLRVSVALTEIVIGVGASWLITAHRGSKAMGAGEGWITFLASAGAVILTFLAGAELDTVAFRKTDAMYTTLLMSTGLTFGTISSLYGLSHGIITPSQYSFLVATVIASAVVPTWIANRFFLPHHHLRPVDGMEGDVALEATAAND